MTEALERGPLVSIGRRIRELAQAHPRKAAIVFVASDGAESTISWGELDERATAAARLLDARGGAAMVAIGLPRCLEHFAFTIGTWKLGGCVLPLSPAMPPPERSRLLALAAPSAIVAGTDWPERTIAAEGLAGAEAAGPELPDRVPKPGKAIPSGGSTGLPKLIVSPQPWAFQVAEHLPENFVGFQPNRVQLVTGPLYHNSPFSNAYRGLFYDHLLIVMDRFDARLALDLIERHRVSFMAVVPTVMKRILEVPDVDGRDLSSLEALFHTGAPCPPWIKQRWIELIGGERVYEGFGGTESFGNAGIRGDEWMLHRGSVGRAYDSEIRILDDEGRDLEPGKVGEIFMRPRGTTDLTFEYVGTAKPRVVSGGFLSIGDMGWIDEDGYLFLADRRTDLILTGGANVYPAEVESALSDHPKVRDVVVIGLPDVEWGQRVHALIEPAAWDDRPTAADIVAHCRARLAPYKVPKTVEFVEHLPRDESGKLRRSALVAERTSGAAAG